MESDGKDLEHNGWVGLAAPRRAVAEGVNKPRRLRAFMSLAGAAVFLSFLLPRRFLHANVAKEISSRNLRHRRRDISPSKTKTTFPTGHGVGRALGTRRIVPSGGPEELSLGQCNGSIRLLLDVSALRAARCSGSCPRRPRRRSRPDFSSWATR